jgi:para-nitrobenzyl esterase
MSDPGPLVTTSHGDLRGGVADGVKRFLGIPFAAPPVGRLRFAPPAPVASWTGELNARAYGSGPIQPVDDLSKTLGLLGDFTQSEDCLTLNLFVPEGESDPRAVMVWLHGGAFQTGTASGPVYDGAALARAGDVIVVTLNYRVGALGFLATGVPGGANLGLQDQVAAMRWVQDEIAAFGGDPKRVTVFGESAGAGSLVALLSMPLAQGLFGRAIIQSAAPEGILSLEEGIARAQIFSSAAGLEEATLEGLRGLAAGEIPGYQKACLESGRRRIGMFFAPVVDGDILPRDPMAAIAAGAAADVELVIGTTAEEMQLYHLTPGFADVPDALLPRYVMGKINGSTEDAAERATELLRVYADSELEGLDRFFALETDASLFFPATRLAESHSKHQPRTFMYRFDFRSPLEGGRLGACHALDIAFVLGNTARVPHLAGEEDATFRLSASMVSAWSGFARTGDPSPPGLTWPSYTSRDRATMIFDDPCQLSYAPNEPRRQAWAKARKEMTG